MVASNPDFVFGLLGSMDPGEVASAVNSNPEAFVKFARALPGEMVRNVDPDIIIEIMGNID